MADAVHQNASHRPPGEFAGALREIDDWNRRNGDSPARIDPGCDPVRKADFEQIGLADMLR